MPFTLINYSSSVMFANKINHQSSITLECVKQQKINTFTSEKGQPGTSILSVNGRYLKFFMHS